MNFNFERILFYITLVAGVICLFDWLFLAKKRRLRQGNVAEPELPVIIDYARSFFPVLLIVFLFRSFAFEPFRIPSGSLKPTLLTGDFILVNKYDYGLRLPVAHQAITQGSAPKRGDIIVFRWPPNPSVDFIKRVVGVPGDKISYINKELYINGNKMTQNLLEDKTIKDDNGDSLRIQESMEDLDGVKHRIYINPALMPRDFKDVIVPEGSYFVMGDNRDDSEDSRYWGFVGDKDIVGKAVLVWMSWDGANTDVRWRRIGTPIH